MTTAPPISEPLRRSSAWVPAMLIVGRVVLGVVFVYSAFAKLHFEGICHLGDYHLLFAMVINSYAILPLWAVQWLARVLPWFELVLGVLLVSGVGLRWIGSITNRCCLFSLARWPTHIFLALRFRVAAGATTK